MIYKAFEIDCNERKKITNENAVVLGMKQTVIRIFNFTLINDPVSIGFKFREI